ncbi:hypothetical protein C8J57DRAFT_1358401, partial [Mycena rebaudengoi]
YRLPLSHMDPYGSFHQLVDDVVLLIVACCDICTALTLSQASRRFHRLVFTKSAWLHFVIDLMRRGFIDKRPDKIVGDMSTDELVEIVKRTTYGPRTWSLPHPPAQEHILQSVARFPARFLYAMKCIMKMDAQAKIPAPIASRKITLHPNIAADTPYEWDLEAKLLPGGQYVLFQNWGKLECWSVFEDRLIWRHSCSMDDADVLVFAADFTDSDHLVVLTGQRTSNEPYRNFVEITTLDLRSGVSSIILVIRAPDSSFYPHYENPVIREDIAAVSLMNHVLLINWRAGSYITLMPNVSCLRPDRLALAADHLVLTLGTDIAVVPIASLDKKWVPIDSLNEPSAANVVRIDDLSKCVSESLAVKGCPFDPVRAGILSDLVVHESPVRRGLFRVWLHARDGYDRAVLCSYDLTVHGPGVVDWKRRLAIPARCREISDRGVTYSGHMLSWNKPLPAKGYFNEILPPLEVAHEQSTVFCRMVAIPRRVRWDSAYLSAYSGTLTHVRSDGIEIVYFE